MDDLLDQITDFLGSILEEDSSDTAAQEMIDKAVEHTVDSLENLSNVVENVDSNGNNAQSNSITDLIETFKQNTVSRDSGVSTSETDFSSQLSEEKVQTNSDSSNTSFKGYTQEEINTNKSNAEMEMTRQKSNMRHHKRMIEIRSSDGLPSNLEQNHYNEAASAYQKANEEYNKWKNMKPDNNS